MLTQSIIHLNNRNDAKVDPVRVLVALEHHFLSGADGHIYTSGPTNYKFWRRYLDVFGEVVVLARVRESTDQMLPEQRADGPGVTFWRLPDYTGPAKYLRKLVQLRSEISKAVSSSHVYILRLPGAIGNLAAREIRRLGKNYAVEVVTDPWDVFSRDCIRTPLRLLYRELLTRSLRRNCREAFAVSYVTRLALQARYPARAGAYSCGISDVELPEMGERSTSLVHDQQGAKTINRKRLVTVASLSHPRLKGVDTLLAATRLCLDAGTDVELTIIGDGESRSKLEILGDRLGLHGRVHFMGQILSRNLLFSYLAGADLFVLASRAEGLPRALIEAMYCGLPCIASRVGGIPELISPDALVPPGNSRALSEAIQACLSDGLRLERMAEENYDRAQTFTEENLQPIRQEFLSYIRDRAKVSGC
jgi:glycosyltransferase involved in cell wall biosynthesis